MNIILFDPTFLKVNKLHRILEAFCVTEVHNLMPYGTQMDGIVGICKDKLVINRGKNEAYNEAKRKTVYSIVDRISTPVFDQDRWTGKRLVADLYKESKCDDLEGNLLLNDPNILIFKEEDKVPFLKSRSDIMSHMLNILHKYGSIPYGRRICCECISKYITLESDVDFFNEYTRHKSPEQILAAFVDIKDPNELAEYFLLKNGIILRNNEIIESFEQVDTYRYDDDNERHYDEYAGTYAQDVAGWSDEDIDDVLDGAPDAYWNID